MLDVLNRHPQRVLALITAALLGTGGAAFAIATLGPDPAELAVREVSEPVAAPNFAAQQDALLRDVQRLYRSENVRSSDTVDTLLARLGVSDSAASSYLRADRTMQTLVLGRVGRSVSAEVSEDFRLLRLVVKTPTDKDREFRRITVSRDDRGFQTQSEIMPLAASTAMASGVIQSSLFAAADDIGMPDAVAVQLAEIFSGDIDFHRSLRKGDRFNVVYEALEADGEPMRTGRVIAAEFVNNGKTHRALWFQEAGGRGGYYSPDGQSLRRAYLASPLEFSRVTSGFKMRFHPILQTWRAHLGVDYGAPAGTPVRSVGDGVVEFAGAQGGFGNVVYVRHRNNHLTVYAHLSKINVHKGQSVAQGQHLGAVGATGWATGPHLHFEFRINGQHQDPMLIARQSEAVPVSAAARPAFEVAAATMVRDLTAMAALQPANAR